MTFESGDLEDVAADIVQSPMHEEVEIDYGKYSLEVIGNRALPDVLDGLKPVQRRILFKMNSEKMFFNGPTKKSGTIVGGVMGSLHPHGDASIYQALVKMAAPYASIAPLIHGHGNFGVYSVEQAAAARYTEAKLSKIGEYLISELGDNVVKTKPTELSKDGTEQEPVVLPAKFPNLLVNGSSGIAVAMATNIPPHNLSEVMNAIIWQLQHQEYWEEIHSATSKEARLKAVEKTVKKLMKYLPAPDFPTGGLIIGADEGCFSAFTTGVGSVIIRGKYKIEQLKGGKHLISFYEIPYGMNPSKTISDITKAERDFIITSRDAKADGGKTKIKGYQIPGLLSVNDSTDINGIRVDFLVDAKTNPESVVAEILKRTDLESSFSYNINALFNNVPRVMALPEVLQAFINFRRNIVLRRSKNELKTRSSRRHIVSGLRSVLVDVDKAIAIIRKAEDQKDASLKLQKHFKIDEEQAKYILDTPLRKLTKYDNLELSKEADSLDARIKELESIIASPELRDELVLKDFKEVLTWSKNNGFAERKSEVLGVTVDEYLATMKEKMDAPKEVQDKPVSVYLSSDGKVRRTAKGEFVSWAETSSLGSLVVFDKSGVAHRMQMVNVTSGTKLPPGTVAVANENTDMVAMTKQGVVYAFSPNYPRKDEFTYFDLATGDEVVAVLPYVPNEDVVFVSSDGSILHFPAEKVSVKASVGGKGMAGMKLSAGANVVAAGLANSNEGMVCLATEQGVKAILLSEILAKGRGTGGPAGLSFRTDESRIVSALVLPSFTDKYVIKSGQMEIPGAVAPGKRIAKTMTMPGVRLFVRNNG